MLINGAANPESYTECCCSIITDMARYPVVQDGRFPVWSHQEVSPTFLNRHEWRIAVHVSEKAPANEPEFAADFCCDDGNAMGKSTQSAHMLGVAVGQEHGGQRFGRQLPGFENNLPALVWPVLGVHDDDALRRSCQAKRLRTGRQGERREQRYRRPDSNQKSGLPASGTAVLSCA